MQKTAKLLAACSLSAVLAGCSGGATTMAKNTMDSGAATAAIAAAKAARSKAATVGGEWRDTAKMIKKAEGLAKEGKTDQAMKLAKQAEMQAQAGYQQSLSQKSAGPRF